MLSLLLKPGDSIRRTSQALGTAIACPTRMHITNQAVLTPPNAAVEPVLQKQLALLLESTGEGIYGIDMEGRCTFINRAGAHMIGRAPDEVLSRRCSEISYSVRFWCRAMRGLECLARNRCLNTWLAWARKE